MNLQTVKPRARFDPWSPYGAKQEGVWAVYGREICILNENLDKAIREYYETDILFQTDRGNLE